MLALLVTLNLDESISQRRQANQDSRSTNQRSLRTNSNRNSNTRSPSSGSRPQRQSSNSQPVNPAPRTPVPSSRRQLDVQYFDYDSLPRGPTRQSSSGFSYEEDYYFDYTDYDPLPSGPTREPPLPSGPTRRPGQPTRLPPAPQVGVSKDVYKNLPLLTTSAPPIESPRRNVNFRIPPPRNRGTDPQFEVPQPHRGSSQRGNRPGGRGSGVFVSSDLNILDQTKLFASMDPNQENFIKAPRLNAGALPLAFEASDSNQQYFFPPLPPLLDGP